jgi:hypothetical protein
MVGEAKGTMSRPSSIGKTRSTMSRTGTNSSSGSAFDDDDGAAAEEEVEGAEGAAVADQASGDKKTAAETKLVALVAKKVAVETADDDADGDVSATVVGTAG